MTELANRIRRQISGVEMLYTYDSPVSPERLVKLTVARVDSHDRHSAALEQTIGKSARGCAYINRPLAVYVHRKRVKRRLKLHSAAADVFEDLLDLHLMLDSMIYQRR